MSNEDENDVKIETTASPGGASDMISIAPPEWEDNVQEEVAIVQEEVSYKDMAFPEVSLGKFEKELLDMVGSDKSVVVAYLDRLKQEGVVNDYLVAPVGAVHTMEMRPGVVKVLVGGEEKVINIEIS